MARRPVFILKDTAPHFRERYIDFKFYTGFAASQKKKSVQSMHEAYLEYFPEAKILEVSRFSDSILGQRLSAFNLRTRFGDEYLSVENVFQSSKVFENGGPFLDLLHTTPAAAKKDTRLTESGKLIAFRLQNKEYPLEPKTFFYDWIYINALMEDRSLMDSLLQYDAFTDIAFNPEKSINCQARTIAIYVSLCKKGKLEQCLKSEDAFMNEVYKI